MAKTYVINESVIYTPSTHSLYSITRNESITMAIPASLCLSLLLKNKGKIVSQTELFHSVWGERGMKVTPNTLHQNISLLRKSLSGLDVDGLVIKTIPRRGFMFSDELVVKESNDDDEYSLADNQDHKGKAGEAVTLTKKECNITPIPNSCLWCLISPWVYIFIGISLLLIAMMLMHNKPINHVFSNVYRELPGFYDCKIFRNNDRQLDAFFSHFIKTNYIICGGTKTIYITNHYPSNRVSLISCEKPISSEKNSNCISTYYLK